MSTILLPLFISKVASPLSKSLIHRNFAGGHAARPLTESEKADTQLHARHSHKRLSLRNTALRGRRNEDAKFYPRKNLLKRSVERPWRFRIHEGVATCAYNFEKCLKRRSVLPRRPKTDTGVANVDHHLFNISQTPNGPASPRSFAKFCRVFPKCIFPTV